MPPTISIGDEIKGNCSSLRSKPPANITFNVTGRHIRNGLLELKCTASIGANRFWRAISRKYIKEVRRVSNQTSGMGGNSNAGIVDSHSGECICKNKGIIPLKLGLSTY